jgi:hypothetical protein
MTAENILIGWAERNITPNKMVNLYGQFHQRISGDIKDPVTITALSLGTEKDYVIMVSCDVCIINREITQQCRTAVKDKNPEIDVKRVILNTTHTHTAPGTDRGWYPPVPEGVMTETEYANFFISLVAESVDEAWRRRKKGAVSWAYGHAVVGHNRRAAYLDDISKRTDYKKKAGRIVDGTSRMYGDTDDPLFSHIEGYEDHSLETVFTYDENNKPTGMLINLACPSQETGGEMYVSADFWHEVREEIHRRFSKDIHILPQVSAAGDQSPTRLLYKKAEERMLKLRGIDMRQEIGRRIASAIEELLPFAKKDIRDTLPFRHITETVRLKKRMVTEEEVKIVKEEMAEIERWKPVNKGEVSQKSASLWRCLNAIKKYEEQKDNPYTEEEIHLIRLGDIAFATNPFELFLDYGLRIKARSPFIQTFIVQLSANSDVKGLYLPTARAVAGKGYSATVYDNNVSPEGGQQLVEETVRVLKELWNG